MMEHDQGRLSDAEAVTQALLITIYEVDSLTVADVHQALVSVMPEFGALPADTRSRISGKVLTVFLRSFGLSESEIAKQAELTGRPAVVALVGTDAVRVGRQP